MRVQPATRFDEAWGWRGRTLGQPVAAPDGPTWLRVASAPSGLVADTFWNGSVEAENSIPLSVPRPRLREYHDWNDGQWKYRAELYDHMAIGTIAPSPTLLTDPSLPPTWWSAMRAVLDEIASVHTRRYTVHQAFLDWAMPHYLGTPVDTAAPKPWSTAHGDFHYANICGPALTVLDWEGWGLAPAGYDAATLHNYSLLVPAAADRIRRELAPVLDTPTGRFAELVVITELLHRADLGDDHGLTGPARERAEQHLGRALPPPVSFYLG